MPMYLLGPLGVCAGGLCLIAAIHGSYLKGRADERADRAYKERAAMLYMYPEKKPQKSQKHN